MTDAAAQPISMSANGALHGDAQESRADEQLGGPPAAAPLAEHVDASAHTPPSEPAASMRSPVDIAVSGGGDGDSAPQPVLPAVDAADSAHADAAPANTGAVTADPDAEGSGDDQDAAGQADVDAWLHDVLQRVQPGCEITVNALHMLGDLFETVCHGCAVACIRTFSAAAVSHVVPADSGPAAIIVCHRPCQVRPFKTGTERVCGPAAGCSGGDRGSVLR